MVKVVRETDDGEPQFIALPAVHLRALAMCAHLVLMDGEIEAHETGVHEDGIVSLPEMRRVRKQLYRQLSEDYTGDTIMQVVEVVNEAVNSLGHLPR